MFKLKIQTRQQYLDDLAAAYSTGIKVGYELGWRDGSLDCQNKYYIAAYRPPVARSGGEPLDNFAAHADELLRELGLEE